MIATRRRFLPVRFVPICWVWARTGCWLRDLGLCLANDDLRARYNNEKQYGVAPNGEKEGMRNSPDSKFREFRVDALSESVKVRR